MVQSRAGSVEQYLAELPAERRTAIKAVAAVVRENLPEGFEECMQYGMIGWVVPFERYPETYNDQPLAVISLASQKNYMSLYLHGVYADEEIRSWFENAWRASGKKLDMGKSCVRFKKVEDLPLEVIGGVVARVSVEDMIRVYEASRRR